ncbi:MAG: iron ABC transporter permease [Pseudomonadales bacterium]|nr:iron ABC transporter permease [Pseudomonadales bacterium]
MQIPAVLKESWSGATVLLALLLFMPVLIVFSSLLQPEWDAWEHLSETVLADYISNTLWLAFGVGAGSLIIGTSLAWCTTHYEFPLRKSIEWLALLPLAMPAYIIAYCYTGLLDFAGPVQTLLRETFGWQFGQYWFPEIRSLPGAIIMLSLVLYPYVYILSRTAFSEQSASLMEVSRSLGKTPSQHFLQVAIPLARPAILTGTALAMMEAFADYGTVQYFGVSTFTTGIFRTWYGMGNEMAAAQLSALLVGFVFMLLSLEKLSRRKIAYYYQGQKVSSPKRQPLSRFASLSLTLLCLLPFILGFAVPVLLLIDWAIEVGSHQLDQRFLSLLINSFGLAASAAFCVVSIALIFGYAKRVRKKVSLTLPIELANLGYAVPGTVVAVSLLLVLTWFDKKLDALLSNLWGVSSGLLLSGTVFALILAYSVRFLAVASNNIESGLGRIKPSMDEAARSLGANRRQVLIKVHLPILKTSILSALLLVFVDIVKELPATLILRPFNFNTLAVRTYELASDERLADAALPALAIVCVSLLPVIILTRAMQASTKDEED